MTQTGVTRTGSLEGDVSKDRQSGACKICIPLRILLELYRVEDAVKSHSAYRGCFLFLFRLLSYFPFSRYIEITRKLTWKLSV